MAQPYYSDQLLQALVFLGEPVFGEPGSTRSVPGKQGSRPDAKPAAKATTGTKPDRTVTGKGRGTVPISYDQRATLAPISVRVREVRRRYEAPELRPRVIDQLARRLDVDESTVLSVAGIAPRTFHRRQKEGEPLTAAESDRVLRIARVSSVAERVFGDPVKAIHWLSKESAILGATPLALLASDAGAREVEVELERIDWGDFA